MLEVRNLQKSFEGKPVLRGISFKGNRGNILCLIGPNGSGKTTTIRIIDLLENPDEGEVLLDGINMIPLAPEEKVTYRRRMAIVFQQPVLYNLSVYDNVAIGLKIRDVDNGAIPEKVNNALKVVKLFDFRNRHAFTLSGGEAQRLCLARAIALDPEVILLDEPTSNLDPSNTVIIENVIKKYIRDKEATAIFTTHNMFEARRLADKVTLLISGAIIEGTDAKTFFNAPKDERTIKFLRGEMPVEETT